VHANREVEPGTFHQNLASPPDEPQAKERQYQNEPLGDGFGIQKQVTYPAKAEERQGLVVDRVYRQQRKRYEAGDL
jgi:hypothetical protein